MFTFLYKQNMNELSKIVLISESQVLSIEKVVRMY